MVWCQVTEIGFGSTLVGGQGKAKNTQLTLVWVVTAYLICFLRRLAFQYIYTFLKVIFSRENPHFSQEDS